MSILSYNKDTFLMDGEPFKILSGAVHYFRTVPEYWEDRLTKLKAMGLNTVETYMCWNLHERKEGEFDFSGMLDVARFVSIAEKLGLYVILRPGPYICAEWDFGGLPGWLHKYPAMRLRCADKTFLEKVKNYMTAVFDQLRSHLSTNGGGIIMVQVENEYGSYGNDKTYLGAIADIYRELGVDVQLFTSDGPCYAMLGAGTLPGVLSVANFGSGAKGAFGLLKKVRPDQPVMCGEFWNGWFDHWYEHHHTNPAENAAKALEEILDNDGSVNLYMLHGGTNFAFTNGANHGGKYEPTITSYDYDSPLTEAGDLTPKYYAFKKVIEDRFGPAPEIAVANSAKAAYGKLELTKAAGFVDSFKKIATSVTENASPLWMEELGQDFGFVMYSTTVYGPFEEANLYIEQLHDRAHIFVNGKFAGIKERSAGIDERRPNDKITLKLDEGETAQLDILVENMGRVNYGGELGYSDKKGLFAVHLGTILFGWTMYTLPMEDFSRIEWKDAAEVETFPAFMRGSLKIEGTPCDTFVDLTGFKKGFVVVNGHNLGRYFLISTPQKTLYLPAPYLKEGENEVIVFESDGTSTKEISFVDTPDLG